MQETSIMGIRRELKKFTEKYNNYRPHQALKYISPMAYLKAVFGAEKCLK
jgi:transposase InsO family protein